MSKTLKVGAGLALLTASIISLGNANDAKAQNPVGYAPNRFTVIEQTRVFVPYTTWQQQTTIVPQTQWVPQTVMVPQTQWVPQTRYVEQIIQRPVTYQRVDASGCPILNGLGQIINGALSLPGEFLRDLGSPCRPQPYCGPGCQPAFQYAVPVVPVVPMVPVVP